MLTRLGSGSFDSLDQGLRDLVALSTLPALWHGAAPQRIAESLAAALFTTLNPEFVYVSFQEHETTLAVVAQTGRYQSSPEFAGEVGAEILRWARDHDPDDLLVLGRPPLEGITRVTTRPLGHYAEFGVIAAGFSSDRLPTPM